MLVWVRPQIQAVLRPELTSFAVISTAHTGLSQTVKHTADAACFAFIGCGCEITKVELTQCRQTRQLLLKIGQDLMDDNFADKAVDFERSV